MRIPPFFPSKKSLQLAVDKDALIVEGLSRIDVVKKWELEPGECRKGSAEGEQTGDDGG